MVRDYVICTLVAIAFWVCITAVIVSNGWVKGSEVEFITVIALTTVIVSGVAYLLERFVFKSSIGE